MVFDTLAYVKHLEEAGVDRKQAEAHAEAMNQYLRPDLATKDDITEVRGEITEVRGELTALRGEMRTEITALEQRLVVRISDLEKSIYKAQLQSIGIVGVMLGILFALLKLT